MYCQLTLKEMQVCFLKYIKPDILFTFWVHFSSSVCGCCQKFGEWSEKVVVEDHGCHLMGATGLGFYLAVKIDILAT